jgi:hypothetical protein
MPDTASPSPLPPLLQSFDDPLGRKIIELHVWAVREGLRGAASAALFEGPLSAPRQCWPTALAGLGRDADIAPTVGRLYVYMVA